MEQHHKTGTNHNEPSSCVVLIEPHGIGPVGQQWHGAVDRGLRGLVAGVRWVVVHSGLSVLPRQAVDVQL
eukprot:4832703-Heterocapsa_arctica.AAC.1